MWGNLLKVPTCSYIDYHVYFYQFTSLAHTNNNNKHTRAYVGYLKSIQFHSKSTNPINMATGTDDSKLWKCAVITCDKGPIKSTDGRVDTRAYALPKNERSGIYKLSWFRNSQREREKKRNEIFSWILVRDINEYKRYTGIVL